MMTVKIYRAAGPLAGETVHVGQARTSDPREAIRRVAKRMIGYGEIGLCEHFPGGGTYHVQFVTGHFHGSTSLSDKYVAQVEA
jgi:hypothetical protein